MNHSRINEFQAYVANVQLAHWQADTRTNVHKTLGELYGTLNELTDDFAEIVLGKDRNTFFQATSLPIQPNVPLGDLIATGRQLVTKTYAELDPKTDFDLQNVVADMLIAINHAAYLLKV